MNVLYNIFKNQFFLKGKNLKYSMSLSLINKGGLNKLTLNQQLLLVKILNILVVVQKPSHG